MNSFIDEYNKKVELDCIKKMKSKTLKVNRDYLASNRVYNKELGGFVAPDLLTNKQFKNTIKNIYEYLGQNIPNEPELEDLYVKAFNDFTEEQYIDFMNLVFLGGFDNIQDAYKSFTTNLQEPMLRPDERTEGIQPPAILSLGSFGRKEGQNAFSQAVLGSRTFLSARMRATLSNIAEPAVYPTLMNYLVPGGLPKKISDEEVMTKLTEVYKDNPEQLRIIDTAYRTAGKQNIPPSDE